MRATNLSYPSNMTDDQWELIERLLPPAKAGGRPRTVKLREIINAIFYLVVTGCPWRYLPSDFPKWKTVYHYFRQWRESGVWQKIHEHLVRLVRVSCGREEVPSAASLDSQSVKIGTPIAVEVGFDGGKLVKGRKRHLLVDTLGLVWMVVVTAANVSDPRGARLLFARFAEALRRTRRLIVIWVDGTYDGIDFQKWVIDTYGWILETIKRSDKQKGFVLLPKRWVVERTWGWLNWYRRLSKDYETLPETSETMIYVAMIRLMLKRLA